MSLTSVNRISPEHSLSPIQLNKLSPVSSLVNRIRDFFKNKILPFFKRLADLVIHPLRHRKVSVRKAPLPQATKAVAKKAEELLPAASPHVEKPKGSERPLPRVSSSPALLGGNSPLPVLNPLPAKAKVQQQEAQDAPQAVARTPQKAQAVPPPPLPAQHMPHLLPKEPMQQGVEKIISFTLTEEIKKLTDSISVVLKNQEAMLTKLKNLPWYNPLPAKKDIEELFRQYEKIRDDGKMLAGNLKSSLNQHSGIPELAKSLEGLSAEANLGMIELQPMVKNGVGLGGLQKLLNGSSPEKETQRGFDLIKRYHAAIQKILNLTNF